MVDLGLVFPMLPFMLERLVHIKSPLHIQTFTSKANAIISAFNKL